MMSGSTIPSIVQIEEHESHPVCGDLLVERTLWGEIGVSLW